MIAFISLHRVLPADEHRMRDDRMADVQFRDFGNRRDRLHIGVMQSVAGIDLQAVLDAVATTPACMRSSSCCCAISVMRIGITAGMESRSPARPLRQRAAICSASGSMNRLTRMPSRLQLLHRCLHLREISDHIQSAFGRDLLAPLRHQADILRPDAAGEVDHLMASPPIPDSCACAVAGGSLRRRHPGCGDGLRADAA